MPDLPTDAVQLKNLPDDVKQGIYELANATTCGFQAPAMPMRWPDLGDQDEQLLTKLRTERKGLKSGMDNNRRTGKLELDRGFKKLMCGLVSWTCEWRGSKVQRIVEDTEDHQGQCIEAVAEARAACGRAPRQAWMRK